MTSYIIPFIIMIIIVLGLIRKGDVFSPFLEGAREGLRLAIDIFPNILGIMTAIYMLRSSGAIELLSAFLTPVLKPLRFPPEVIPLAVLRPVSGSGALSIVKDILETYGPDSYIGRVASVMMGSTETTFYTVALYFGVAGIKNIRHTLKAALAADITGIILSIIICNLFFRM